MPALETTLRNQLSRVLETSHQVAETGGPKPESEPRSINSASDVRTLTNISRSISANSGSGFAPMPANSETRAIHPPAKLQTVQISNVLW